MFTWLSLGRFKFWNVTALKLLFFTACARLEMQHRSAIQLFEATVSWHHRCPIQSSPEIPCTSQHYRIERCKGNPWLTHILLRDFSLSDSQCKFFPSGKCVNFFYKMFNLISFGLRGDSFLKSYAQLHKIYIIFSSANFMIQVANAFTSVIHSRHNYTMCMCLSSI